MKTTKSGPINIKELLLVLTAGLAFVLGWGLTVWGFLIPPQGEVHDSVLWILGQALIYTASALGIGMYVHGAMSSIERKQRDFMRKVERAVSMDDPEETE